jgi:hypothetical protein
MLHDLVQASMPGGYGYKFIFAMGGTVDGGATDECCYEACAYFYTD